MYSPAETFAAWEAGQLGELVTETLAPLVGTRFAELGRAADLIWMGFGDEVSAPSQLDPGRRMAQYRLHVQCPFRLDSATQVIVTAADVYRPAADPSSSAAFDWDVRGSNVFDVAVDRFWADRSSSDLTVDAITADRYGGLELGLSDGYALRVFPDRSGLSEHWRYFEAHGGGHFVVIQDARE